MGGTSTDVAHFDGEFERAFETEVAGVRMRAPMMSIHTVAAGGGSILAFDGARFRVGPESAGADPGPRAYRRGGPLTVTDANLMTGKLLPEFFPKIFGPWRNEPLDAEAVRDRLRRSWPREIGDGRSAEAIADGFLAIATAKMAEAIKKISVARGYDVTQYALNCFGGAGGQHACDVADALAIETVLIHPLSSLLSAYGMGLAEIGALRGQGVEGALDDATLRPLPPDGAGARRGAAAKEVEAQGVARPRSRRGYPRGCAMPAPTPRSKSRSPTPSAMRARVRARAQGAASASSTRTKPIVFDSVHAEAHGGGARFVERAGDAAEAPPSPWRGSARGSSPRATGATRNVYLREDLAPGATRRRPGARHRAASDHRRRARLARRDHGEEPCRAEARAAAAAARRGRRPRSIPCCSEIFNNLFMSIAEQMGVTLQNTAYSVNIKERLDFSCAVFDGEGALVANAPHMPVHLGSMDRSVETIIRLNQGKVRPGDVFALNAPYNGGTHLPDITVCTPVFDEGGKNILFWVASRGHHADVGGVAPGSMSPRATTIDEEGVYIDNFKLVDEGPLPRGGALRSARLRRLAGAQSAAERQRPEGADRRQREGRRGAEADGRACSACDTVQAYMGHVQDNAAESVRRVIDRLTRQRLRTSRPTRAPSSR